MSHRFSCTIDAHQVITLRIDMERKQFEFLIEIYFKYYTTRK